jgi:hypothetical protein
MFEHGQTVTATVDGKTVYGRVVLTQDASLIVWDAGTGKAPDLKDVRPLQQAA